MNMLRVNGDRLWSSLTEMGGIGGTPGGGCRRLALSEEERQARDLFCRWAREAGCEVTVDAIGNIFARREGTDPDASPVAMGSHLDTVPTGGRFDGAYGVLAGLEALRRLDDLGLRTRRPIELVSWTNEEGARFSPMTMGSSVFTGAMTLDFALSRRDPAGLGVGEALQQIGYAGDAPVGGRSFASYFEVHIEQGPLLKEGGEQIGIVTGSFKARYFVATIKGEPAHVGPTPMTDRRDAMVGAAALTLEIDRIGRAHGRDGRSNAPYLELDPNVRGVIPQEVRLSCDVRHSDPDTALAMEEELRDACRRIAGERNLSIDLDQYFEFGPIRCDRATSAIVRDAASELGFSHRDILTVASHDAVPMMDHCPSALFFIPSETGISHSEKEYSTPEQCRDGADVLLNAVLRAAA
ncbi:N-carbamoyl-L-amino-acid hydrolase [Enterovirga rhinocerotis]|uniref:N-carbamoyl-L-amino-acid hydrolase n=2 Tax=Enterovirga rhinocerotis TaxID=1339210 RepID=A0A4R7BZ00_9HYPH|nr:N-carbamoyl-L-amino-acid hydrolase [Enterovirga rhinocerotis]